MRKHVLAFVDTETTGVDVYKHELIEIGVVLVKQTGSEGNPNDLEVIETFEIKIKPTRIEDADPVALKVNHYKKEDWEGALSLKEAMNMFARKVKDTIMVSHNVAFDAAFIDKAFHETGVKNPMHYHRLDTISIAYAKIHDRSDINHFSLRSLCAHFEIPNKNAHTALADAEATFELYKKLLEL